ncbi:unnamed protein product [Symbiodinium sp. KB8]|nr:unnamed protein product [Symbiodinium sp. KB8]
MRTSDHEEDGRGCQYQQIFFDNRAKCHCNHVPPRYLVAVKTDCLVYQSLPRKFLKDVEALARRRHRGCTPRYRFEEVKSLQSIYSEPRLEAEPPAKQEPWRHTADRWEVTQPDVGLWADIAELSTNRDVKSSWAPAKGLFVEVKEVGERFLLDEELRYDLRERQGLTLRGRVWLCDAQNPHFSIKHLYVGASRCTAAELLSVL